MSKRSSTGYHQQSFQQISFQINTNKKEKKVNDFNVPTMMGRTLANTERKTQSYKQQQEEDNTILMDQVTTALKYDIRPIKYEYRQ